MDNLTRLKNFLNKITGNAFALFFPEKCLNCKKRGDILCQNCLKKLPQPINNANNAYLWSATSYCNKTVKQLIWHLKYRNIKSAALATARLILLKTPLAGFAGRQDCLLVPIPLSREKLKKRGYNQTELISKILAENLKIKMETGALYKKINTTSQVKIRGREKRIQNVAGSFEVRKPETIKDKTIFVIDDVMTTGATIKEASKVLLGAGAGKVIGVVAAK